MSTIEMDCLDVLEFTVNTEGAGTGAKTAQLPLRVIDSSNSEKMTIDWGDGSAVETNASGYASNSTHTYASAGTYQITVGCLDWGAYAMDTANKETFRKTLVSVDSKLPPMGVFSLNGMFSGCTALQTVSADVFNDFSNVEEAQNTFSGCTALTYIPASLLKKFTHLQNITGMFSGCSSLTYIPSGLFSQCTALTTADSVFNGCSGLTYFPSTLFLNNAALTSRANAFAGCSNTNPTMNTKAQLETAGKYVELVDTQASINSNGYAGIPFNMNGSRCGR